MYKAALLRALRSIHALFELFLPQKAHGYCALHVECRFNLLISPQPLA
jgi:hypothetical protein